MNKLNLFVSKVLRCALLLCGLVFVNAGVTNEADNDAKADRMNEIKMARLQNKIDHIKQIIASRDALSLAVSEAATEVAVFVASANIAQDLDSTLDAQSLFDVASLGDGLSLDFRDGINYFGHSAYLTEGASSGLSRFTLRYGVADFRDCIDLARLVHAELSEATCGAKGLSVHLDPR
jgi:hypothetical protein